MPKVFSKDMARCAKLHFLRFLYLQINLCSKFWNIEEAQKHVTNEMDEQYVCFEMVFEDCYLFYLDSNVMILRNVQNETGFGPFF